MSVSGVFTIVFTIIAAALMLTADLSPIATSPTASFWLGGCGAVLAVAVMVFSAVSSPHRDAVTTARRLTYTAGVIANLVMVGYLIGTVIASIDVYARVGKRLVGYWCGSATLLLIGGTLMGVASISSRPGKVPTERELESQAEQAKLVPDHGL